MLFKGRELLSRLEEYRNESMHHINNVVINQGSPRIWGEV